MKKYIFFLILIIPITGCLRLSDKEFYIENINTSYFTFNVFENSLSQLNKEFDYWFNDDSYYLVPWYEKFVKANLYADSLFNILEQIKISRIPNYSDTIFKVNDIFLLEKLSDMQLTTEEINFLSNKIQNYNFFIKTTYPDTINPFEFFDKNIINQKEVIKEIFPQKMNSYQFFAVLTHFQLQIRKIQLAFAHYYESQIDAGSWRFNRIEAICVPNSKIISLEESYKAEIFLGQTNDYKYSLFVIENDTLKTDKKIIDYTKKVNKIGKNIIDVVILRPRINFSDTLKYPFKIEYEVIK